MAADTIVMSLLTIVVCFVVLSLNKSQLSKTSTYGLTGIVFLESLRIFLSFPKINMIFPLVIIIACLYFYYNKETIKPVEASHSGKYHFHSFEEYFPLVSLIILSLLMVLEWTLFDGNLNSNGYLLIIFSLLLIFARNVPRLYNREYAFLLVFFFLLVVIMVVPSVSYKFYTNSYESTHGGGWVNNEYMVSQFLTIPLANLLTVLGYTVDTDGKILYYEDLSAGRLAGVEIAESCSGLYSIAIFVAAFLSYSFINYKMSDFRTISMISLGVIVCYICNLFRMAIIVMAGHYYGHETLLWVHSNLGWLIFVIWISLFWLLIEKILIPKGHGIKF